MVPIKKISESKKALADNLSRIRLERQASLEHISSQAKLKSATIKEIEAGKANPTLKEIIKLASVLEVPVHELLAVKTKD